MKLTECLPCDKNHGILKSMRMIDELAKKSRLARRKIPKIETKRVILGKEGNISQNARRYYNSFVRSTLFFPGNSFFLEANFPNFLTFIMNFTHDFWRADFD
jgi:hypothetical protein